MMLMSAELAAGFSLPCRGRSPWPHPTRRCCSDSSTRPRRNSATSAAYLPSGTRTPCSHQANVEQSTPIRCAASFCVILIDVRCRTSRPARSSAYGNGLYPRMPMIAGMYRAAADPCRHRRRSERGRIRGLHNRPWRVFPDHQESHTFASNSQSTGQLLGRHLDEPVLHSL